MALLASDMAAVAEGRGGDDDHGQRQRLTGQVSGDAGLERQAAQGRPYRESALTQGAHGLSVAGEGAMDDNRECYLRGAEDTPDEAEWRTEIGWAIFRADGRAFGP